MEPPAGSADRDRRGPQTVPVPPSRDKQTRTSADHVGAWLLRSCARRSPLKCGERLISDGRPRAQVYRLRVDKSSVGLEQELVPCRGGAPAIADTVAAQLAAMTRADAGKWGKIIRQLGLAQQAAHAGAAR